MEYDFYGKLPSGNRIYYRDIANPDLYALNCRSSLNVNLNGIQRFAWDVVTTRVSFKFSQNLLYHTIPQRKIKIILKQCGSMYSCCNNVNNIYSVR